MTFMKRIAPALLLAVSAISAAHAQLNQADACKVKHQNVCISSYEKAKSQCERYFIARTEARPICIETALNKKNLCIEEAATMCPAATPAAQNKAID